MVLVGYTNAGKSTLFNALTSGGAVSEDRLFATLDPTMRQLDIAGLGHVVLADTVGFIRDLPHSLVEAFKATLEEVRDADLLLLVVDGADAAAAERETEVLKVLKDIDALGVPRLVVYNKADRVPASGGEPASLLSEGSRWVSAQTGAGLAELTESIGSALGRHDPVRIELEPSQGRLHAWLHQIDAVMEEGTTARGGWSLLVQLDAQGLRRLVQEGVEVIEGGTDSLTGGSTGAKRGGLPDEGPDQLAGGLPAS